MARQIPEAAEDGSVGSKSSADTLSSGAKSDAEDGAPPPQRHHRSEPESGLDVPIFRRRCTSPVCSKTIELAAGMVGIGTDNFRHSPSPVRKVVSSPSSARSLSAAEKDSPSSSLTGLFRRKRSPMELSSQSFNVKSQPTSPGPSLKTQGPGKPQRLNTTYEHPKGRSLSPMPTGNMLAAMVMSSIQSAVLDVGQSSGERQSRKTNHQKKSVTSATTSPTHQKRRLPRFVLNADPSDSSSSETSSSEPGSPDLRQLPLSYSLPYIPELLLYQCEHYNLIAAVEHSAFIKNRGASWRGIVRDPVDDGGTFPADSERGRALARLARTHLISRVSPLLPIPFRFPAVLSF